MRNNITTIYDILKTLIQYGLPIVGVVVGIFLGKWIEKRHDNDKLKREIYLEANRALSRYKDTYLATSLNFNNENMQRLHEQQMLTEAAKADLEIIGSDKVVESYSDCLKFIVQRGKDVLSETQKGKTAVSIGTNINKGHFYDDFLKSWHKWNNIVREDLKIVKK